MLAAAWLARLVADELAARWVAVAAAALVVTPAIDLVAVKGELLSLPFLVAGAALALAALRDRTADVAFAAGVWPRSPWA